VAVDAELRKLLNSYLAQESDESPGFRAHALAHLATTYLDWDGPVDVKEIEELLRRQATAT
jgi:hypothetical protein